MIVRRWVRLMIFVCGCAASCLGQATPTASTPTELKLLSSNSDLPPAETIRKDVDEVNLVFSARGRGGRFIHDLQLEEIDLRDDHLPPVSISHFETQTDLPLRIAVVVDTSDSVAERFAFEKASAIAFLRRTLRAGVDRAFVIEFNQRAQVAQDWTDDIRQLEHSLLALRGGGETAFYDAVVFASRKLAETQQHSPRRVMIVISDGEDNKSTAGLQGAIEAVLRSEAVAYTLRTRETSFIHCWLCGYENTGDEAMYRLADATGGRVLSAGSDRQIAAAFQAIQQELRSQYLIAYKPADFRADGRYRSIELKSRQRHGLRFGVRRGYYTR
jgi:Ca-activated chloride channel homolog